MRFAVVNPSGGIVSNVVVGDDIEAVMEAVGPCVQETEITGHAAAGFVWDGSVFIGPEPEPNPEIEPEG